jgi:Putative auto-transporter adhesin, head GIN domain
MRRWRILVLAGVLAAGGCGQGLSITTGSDEVVTETRELEPFQRLRISSSFDVDVTPGERDEVTLRVSENLQDRVRAGVDGDTLTIELEPGLNLGDATLEADVTASTLRQIEASGASTVSFLEPVEADEFVAGLSGASRLDGEVALERLEVGVSGASHAELRGSAEEADVEASGASEMVLTDLVVRAMEVGLSGASSAEVTVEGELAYSVSGASNLTYAGGPEIVRQEVSGASSVEGG